MLTYLTSPKCISYLPKPTTTAFLSAVSPVKVKCSANYCIHNENSECIAKEITVGNENANYRSETECDSFKAR